MKLCTPKSHHSLPVPPAGCHAQSPLVEPSLLVLAWSVTSETGATRLEAKSASFLVHDHGLEDADPPCNGATITKTKCQFPARTWFKAAASKEG